MLGGVRVDTTRHEIILVDDNATNLITGRSILKSSYKVYPALSAAKLFDILDKVIPDLILLDIFMPEMDGYETIIKLKADTRFQEIPVIFLTAMDGEENELKGLELGAADYIAKPFSAPLLLKRIENQLLIAHKTKDLLSIQAVLKDYADNLEAMVHEKTAEVFNLQNAVLTTVADLVDFRDKQTGGHITSTQHYLQILLEEMLRQEIYVDETTKWDLDFFLLSAQLHDVGKIAIADEILRKPGKLTPEEFEVMKTHVEIGVNAIERIMEETNEHSFLRHALLIVGTHHEKWDGSGYPLGLKGENIPLEGRLMAIADVYDALISDRPYKKAFSHEQACKIIEDNAGTQFDPALIDVFKKVKADFAEKTHKPVILYPNN